MTLPTMLDHRLLVVTGKGGVGKSTTAAALALAGARTGRRTALVEVEGRQTFPSLFDTPAWDFEEREVRPGLFGVSIDAEDSLQEYLELFYGAKRLSRFVVGSTAVEFATTAAPGIKDVLLIGKVKEMERRRDADGRFTYDLIVLDAPPTGRIVGFLSAPEATVELVNMGPIRQQARSVVDMITDQARTLAVPVTVLEDLPVTETLEGAAALRELGVALGPVVVNRVLPTRLDAAAQARLQDGLTPQAIARRATDAGAPLEAQGAEALLAQAEAEAARVALQVELRERLRADLDAPLLELPEHYAESFGPAEISALAGTIEELVR